MRPTVLIIALGVAVAVVGCADRPKEWMKVNQQYTSADFRRDYDVCSKSGKLDEACMRSRGWVAVSPGREEKKPEPQPIPGQPRGRYQ